MAVNRDTFLKVALRRTQALNQMNVYLKDIRVYFQFSS